MRVLSFGGGVQTTALTILAAQGKVKVDVAVFADTGAEKPETYWYMEHYTKPLLESAGIPFKVVRNEQPYYQPDLYGFLYRHQQIPNVRQRDCSHHYKIFPITKFAGDATQLVGFSYDEVYRINRGKLSREYPLVLLGLTGEDCRRIICSAGLPIPVKSACFFCPFQRVYEWQWLKREHTKLFNKALELERNFYNRKPELKAQCGLFGNKPLWHYAEGRQDLLFTLNENSCWDGACGH